MDSAQIMMTPVMPQTAAPVVVETGNQSSMSADNEAFSTLLGQVLSNLPLELGAEQAAVSDAQPVEVSLPTALIPDVVQEVSDEQQPVEAGGQDNAVVAAKPEQQAAQLLAGYMQAAMMVVPQQQVVNEQPQEKLVAEAPVVSEITSVSRPVELLQPETLDAEHPSVSVGALLSQAEEATEAFVLGEQRQQVARTEAGTPLEQRPVAANNQIAKTDIVPQTSERSIAANQQQVKAALQVQQGQSSESNRTQQPVEPAVSAVTNRQASASTTPETTTVQEVLPAASEAVTVQKPSTPQTTSVRFAQQPDVVAASSAMNGQGEETAQSQFGSATKEHASQPQMRGKLSVATAPEVSGNETNVTSAVQVKNADHGMFGVQQPRHQVASEVVATSDQLPQVSGEHVARQVADRITSQPLKQGNDQISLKLSPEYLGNLQLNLRMEDQRLRVEVIAEQRGVRDALLQQVEELKETLARQNITMDSFDVTTGMGSGQQQAADWRQTASERRPMPTQQYAANRNAAASAGGMDAKMRYFAPQYQSTLDVRF